MAKVIELIPKQSIRVSTTLYSSVYEVTDYACMCFELRAFVYSGSATITGTIEHTADPDLDPNSWVSYTSGTVSAATGNCFGNGSTPPLRFMRGKVVTASTNSGVLHFQCIARESS